MDVLIGWKEKEYEFAGSKVTIEVRPLQIAAMIALLPHMVDAPTDDGDMKLAIESSLRIQEVAAEFFFDHVRNVRGITINGETIENPAVLCQEIVFSTLVVQIVGDLIQVSTLSETNEINLDEPVT